MEQTKINLDWPNGLRWFLSQDLTIFTPWQFIKEPDEMSFAANAFHSEDIKHREVFVFCRRQDSDDFAGMEIINGLITDNVIYFHPVFGNNSYLYEKNRNWDIVCGLFDDIFDFTARCIIPDMKNFALNIDFTDM